MFLKLPFAVSFSALFITIQYVVFRKSFRTSYVSLCIYIYALNMYNIYIYIAYAYMCICIYIYDFYLYALYVCAYITCMYIYMCILIHMGKKMNIFKC